MSQRQYVRSVQRALSILEVLMRDGERSVGQLEAELGLSKGSVHRLLKTLQTSGFVAQNPFTRKYGLSPHSRRLCYLALGSVDLRERTLPFLQELQKASGENVSLAILEGDEVVYLERLGSQQLLSINIGVGARFRPHCTAAGKVLLAYLPPAVRRALVTARPLERYTRYTIADPDHLLKTLDQVAKQGWAECDREIDEAVSSVAAPVRDYTGRVVAAVNVVGPSFRLTDRVRRGVVPLLLRAVVAASSALGWEPEEDPRRRQADAGIQNSRQ
ncbi:MAG: IclR family transcriptional regulator [Acetobacteraceae bacterium]|nr:IclR family transcriptional regulator [Acetobacteraceae bacterium]